MLADWTRMISRFYAPPAKSEPGPIDQPEWLFKEPPALPPVWVGNVTNYIELYNTVYGARVGCSKNRRNCSKKVTYGRIPCDTMHMRAIHGGGYHLKPCIPCSRCMFHQTYKNDDDDCEGMIKRGGPVIPSQCKRFFPTENIGQYCLLSLANIGFCPLEKVASLQWLLWLGW